jgi:sulfatase modifying factor 1
MRVRPASSRLRFSCGVGVSIFLVGAAALVAFDRLAAADPVTDAGAGVSPEDLVLDLGGGTLETRKVTHGSFTMGGVPGDPGHEKDEEPAHQVTITKDFWIGKYPVTRGQFAKFVADTRYVTDAEKGQVGGAGWDGKPVDGGKVAGLVQKKDFTWRSPGFTQTDTHPVVLVSYGDATAFVGWASRKSGKRVRLPTEAEWEFAARAGTTTAWSGGAAAEAEPAAYGWFKTNSGNGTRPVGQKKANPLGVFDMSGNVMEWCRDIFAPYREGAVTDPETTAVTGNEPERRVLRGGSWYRDPKRGRSAARYKNAPGARNADNGFRVLVTNEEAVAPVVSTPGPDFVPAAPVGLGAGGGAGAGAGVGAPSASGSNAATLPSGPLADGEALRVHPAGGAAEPISWGLLLISPLAAASAVVAWMLLRRKRRPAGAGAGAGAEARASAVGVSTRAGTDGFFVRASGVMPGARVRYACIVNGKEVTDVVPLDGDKETFVYTGSPPSAIRVLEIVAGARGHGAAARASAMPAPPVPQRSPPPVPARPVAPPVPLAPPVPPSVPGPPPSSPRPAVDSPRALIVPELEPEVILAAPPAGSGATVDGLASTDVDLSSSRDVALAAKVVAAAIASPPPPMSAAEAFKVEPLEPDDEAAPKAEEPKPEEPKPEEPKPEEPKPEEPKPEEPKPEEPKPEEPKPEEPKPEEPKPEEPKPEEPKPEEPKPEEPKPEEPKP